MTLPPPVQGQNHDRNEPPTDHEASAASESNPPTPPPINPDLLLETMVSSESVDNVPSLGLASAPPERSQNLVRVSSNGSMAESDGDDDLTPPIRPDQDRTLGIPPLESINGSAPPPPPPEDHEMSDGEDEHRSSRWRPMPEDTSTPNEIELKEIEAKVEHSAHDHQYWESQTFFKLEDPEHIPKESGRIEWLVDNYNGTKEKPNQEVVMRSPAVRIGGYDWQVKFYPKGNDSEYLSVYVECVGLMSDPEKPSKPEEKVGEHDLTSTNHANHITSNSEAAQHCPLPSLEEPSQKPPTQRPSIAAQFSIIVYNPDEPRVNHFHHYTHRFCPNSTDWGSTRFHGPFYRICYREPYERQALLRNDKLAFTAYVRTIDDATGCLWEHSSDSNPWDSFTMTGLHSLSSPASCTDGNIVAALSSWMLFQPFRQLLYNIETPDPVKAAHKRPMPVIDELQYILFQMRQSKPPCSGKISLEGFMDQLDFYGIAESMQNMDVVEIWEVLRAKMEDELRGTAWANCLNEIFGPAKDYIHETPNRRIKIEGFGTITEALASANLSFTKNFPTPSILCLELDRQTFDSKARRWKKITDKITLNDRITVNGEPFVLYGHVSHRGELQSGSYYSTLRPLGTGERWYRYNNRSSDCKVTCITQREVAQEEGWLSRSSRDAAKGVAYIVMYVREQIFSMQQLPEPTWNVPPWFSVEQDEKSILQWDILDVPTKVSLEVKKLWEAHQDMDGTAMMDLQIIDSKAFELSQKSRMLDLDEVESADASTGLLPTLNISLPANTTLKDVQEHLQKRIPNVQDRRQCVLFLMDSREGSGGWLHIRRWHDHAAFPVNLWMIGQLYPEARLWLHVIPLEAVKDTEKTNGAPNGAEATPKPENQNTGTSTQAINERSGSSQMEQTRNNQLDGGDSPMADADESDLAVEIPSNPIDIDTAVIAPAIIASLNHIGDLDGEIVAASEHLPPPGSHTLDSLPRSNPDPIPEAIMEDSSDLPVAIPPPPIPPIPPPPINLSDDLPNGKELSPLEVYIFLKIFDVPSQTLKHVSSHLIGTEECLEVVFKLLNTDKTLDLWEETKTSCIKLTAKETFAQQEFHDGAVIIVREQVADPIKYLAQGCFVEPKDFIRAQAAVRNFPHLNCSHITRSYFSSSFFRGMVRHGKPHGLGEDISLGNNEAYRGDFALGLRHGYGRLQYANGDIYEGTFECGVPSGEGRLVEDATGNVYSGGWKNGKRHGHGVTVWKQAEDESGKRCKICWESDADTAFLQCGHVAACMECAQNLDDCPVCRGRVAGVVKLYFVS